MNNKHFKEGEHIVYQNGDRFEIGKIKRITKDGAFVYYSSGDTAAKTPFDCMHKLVNEYTINNTSLGGSCWISVDHTLPTFTGDVLVFCGINVHGEGMHNEVRVANYNTVSKRFTVHEYQSAYIGDITHWMPLPLQPLEV